MKRKREGKGQENEKRKIIYEKEKERRTGKKAI